MFIRHFSSRYLMPAYRGHHYPALPSRITWQVLVQ
jgi:hypothetical protein